MWDIPKIFSLVIGKQYIFHRNYYLIILLHSVSFVINITFLNDDSTPCSWRFGAQFIFHAAIPGSSSLNGIGIFWLLLIGV